MSEIEVIQDDPFNSHPNDFELMSDEIRDKIEEGLQQDIILKKGKFGPYFVWKDSNISLKTNRGIENITMDDVISLISREKIDITSTIRKISDSISIRQGKEGKSDYFFFKTDKMKKPSFLSIECYDGNYKSDDLSAIKSWIREKYGIY